MRTFTDEEVTQVRARMGLEEQFGGAVKNGLEYGIPECCIMFQLHFLSWFPDMSVDDAGKFLETFKPGQSPRSLSEEVALLINEGARYLTRAAAEAEAAGMTLYYNPCPACFLAKRFVQIPSTAKGIG